MKFSLIICLFALLCSCSAPNPQPNNTQEWMQTNGRLKVLSTTAMIDDIVKRVGGHFVDSITLIKGELDPHSYQLVKGDDEKLAFADIIFSNGLGLEHGATLQSFLSEESKVIPLANRVIEDEPSLLLYYKGQPDPHIWMDISLWTKIISHIVNTLSSKDPSHEEYYHKNGKTLLETMLNAHEAAKEKIQLLPSSKRYLVTSHDAFNYFTRAYLAVPGENDHSLHERFAAPEGLAPESQISSTDIQGIIEHLQSYNIHVIFPESNVNRDSIRKIVEAAKSKGLNVRIATTPLYADAMGPPGSDGDTYLKMIQHNIDVFFNNIKGD
ncbi:MAG: zinc ABC transporter substrate-binding protein [Parachlamydiaceae bacterium]